MTNRITHHIHKRKLLHLYKRIAWHKCASLRMWFAAICLQVSHYRYVAICFQCLVRVYVVVWPAANSSLHTSRGSPWFLSSWPTLHELVSNMDDKQFNCITPDEHYVLHQLFPPERPDWLSVKPRRYELCLTSKFRLDELIHLHRLQYSITRHVLNVKFYAIFVSFICYLCCIAASCQLLINEYPIL